MSNDTLNHLVWWCGSITALLLFFRAGQLALTGLRQGPLDAASAARRVLSGLLPILGVGLIFTFGVPLAWAASYQAPEALTALLPSVAGAFALMLALPLLIAAALSFLALRFAKPVTPPPS